MIRWLVLGGVGLFLPRVVLFFCWVFGTFANVPWGPCCALPLLGFLFLPYTTLTFGFAYTLGDGISFFWFILLIIAVLVDFGALEETHRYVKTPN